MKKRLGISGPFPIGYVIMKDFVYKHVILIGVDGAGNAFKDIDMPAFNQIFAKGAVNDHVLTAAPTISAECWGSMLLGVTPRNHQLTNLSAGREAYTASNLIPSVFRVIREDDPMAVLASFCNWHVINIGIVDDDIHIDKDGGTDEEITDKVCKYIKEKIPKFLFVQFNGVDAAGHDHGYGGEAYLMQIHKTDGYIEKIFNACEDADILKDTLFIVTADHGGNDHSHGGMSERERYVMYAACGKTVVNGTIGDMEIRDNAAIIVRALGLAQPKEWTARVPSGLFKGVTAGERPVFERPCENPFRLHKPIHEIQFQNQKVCLGEGMPRKDCFSLTFWLKTDGVSKAVVFSNWEGLPDTAAGFCVRVRSYGLLFEYGDGTTTERKILPYPKDFRDGWVYVRMTVDPRVGELKIGYDAEEYAVVKLNQTVLQSVWTEPRKLYTGIGYGADLYTVVDNLTWRDGES